MSIYPIPTLIPTQQTPNTGWYRTSRHDDKALALCVGNTNLRLKGEIRFNDTTATFEGFNGTTWIPFQDYVIHNDSLNITAKINTINDTYTDLQNRFKDLDTKFAEVATLKTDLENRIQEMDAQIALYRDLTRRQRYKYVDTNIRVGDVVILYEPDTVARYSSHKTNAFIENCNVIGIIDVIIDSEYVEVVTDGLCNMQKMPSENVRSGCLLLVDRTGNIIWTNKKPLEDFIQIGFYLGKNCIYVKPIMHIL